ncbi:MAG: contractile injection system tape measure protein [Dickeya sp.]
MTQPHRIHTASLTIDFCHPSEAERFEREAPHLVQHQLLPLIDTLFDQYSPPHQLWVIDHLNCDLGALSASDLASALLAALQQQLTQQLTQALRAQRRNVNTPDDGHEAEASARQAVPQAVRQEEVRQEVQQDVLDGPAAQWRQLAFYLQHGVMPWHYPSRQGWWQVDNHRRHWLTEAVRLHATQLNQLLNASPHAASLIARLVSQLPLSALNGWLEQLSPAHQDMALRCLAERPQQRDMPAALRGRLHRHWHQRIHQALQQHRLRQELLPVWSTLLGEQRPRFLLALYACGQHPDVVRAMAQALDDTTFNDLLILLAPQAQPFIQQVLNHPMWLRQPDDVIPPAEPPYLLREFTLHYLLVQRGGQFNKQRYMAGLIGRLAAHHNRERTEVLQSLYLHLAAWPGDRALKQPLLSLLTTLWEEMAAPARSLPLLSVPLSGVQPVQYRATTHERGTQRQTTAEAFTPEWRQHWLDTLQQADEAAFHRLWRHSAPAVLLMLRPLLIHCGQQSQVRQRWAVRFSAAARYRLLTLLEPTEAPFIRDLMAEVSASQSAINAHAAHAPGEPLLTHSLWSLTFSYLLVERGSEFNRHSYLEALLRQLAAHHNLSRQTLVEALLQHLRHTTADSEVRRSLLALLSRWQDSEPGAPSLPPSPSPSPSPSKQPQPSAGQTFPIEADFPPPADPLLDAACYQYLHDVLIDGSPARRFTPTQAVPDTRYATSSPAGADLLYCLQQLQRHHPLLIQRWLAVSTHHPASWLRLCAALRPSHAARLLALLVMLRQPSANLRHLSATLDTATRRLSLAQRQAFYGQMIDTLAANRTPDWLAIRDAVSQANPATSETTTRQPASNTVAQTPRTIDEANALALLQRIADHGSATVTESDLSALPAALARLLPAQPEAIRRLLLPALRSSALGEQLADRLPDTLHTALLLLLRRHDFLALYPYGRLVTNLCYRHPAYYDPDNYDPANDRASSVLEKLFRRALYHALFATDSPMAIAAFIRYFLDQLAADWQTRSHQASPAAFYRFLLEQAQAECLPATRLLVERLQQLITTAGLHQDTPPAAPADIADGSDTGQPAEHHSAEEPCSAPSDAEDTPLPALVAPARTPVISDWQGDNALRTDEPLSVANAGLVLASPWLPRLLARLGWVQDGEFTAPDARYQAIYCLQYLVNPQPDYAEYQLALNKLLCGVPLNAPLPRAMTPDTATCDTLDTLLAAILQHWNALGHTSVEGLRQTFLQREGILWRQADSWKLEVDPGPFDMLLDRLPWGYSTIKYPWMDRPLHVVWR